MDHAASGVKDRERPGTGGDRASPHSPATPVGFRETYEPSWAPAVLAGNWKSELSSPVFPSLRFCLRFPPATMTCDGGWDGNSGVASLGRGFSELALTPHSRQTRGPGSSQSRRPCLRRPKAINTGGQAYCPLVGPLASARVTAESALQTPRNSSPLQTMKSAC